MSHYVIYDKVTGRIDRTFSGPEVEVQLNLLSSEDYLLEDISLKDGRYYVSAGAYVPCQNFNINYDSSTGQYNTPFWIEGIPAGTIISGSWFDDREASGDSEVFTLKLGNHWIHLAKTHYVDYLLPLTVRKNLLKIG